MFFSLAFPRLAWVATTELLEIVDEFFFGGLAKFYWCSFPRDWIDLTGFSFKFDPP